MEEQATIETASPADTPAADNQSFGSVNDTFASLINQSDQPEAPTAMPNDPPATMTRQADDQSAEQGPVGDDLPEFSLEDAPTTLEKLYSADELSQLAQTDPNAAWAYAEQANAYLQQNLQTIQEITQAAEKVGSVEALQTLGDLGAALFTPGEESPAQVYQALLQLQDSYPDPQNGPLNQVARALVNYRAPEMLVEMGDQLTSLLDGTHPYFDLNIYQPKTETDRYQAQQYIGQLQAQRTALLEALAPAVYRHFGNDFALREQYQNVGPEGEYFGLADNTLDKEVRQSLPEELRATYDALPPTIRGKMNAMRTDEIQDNLTQRKEKADAKAELEQLRKESEENIRKVNERIEAQVKEAADARATAWESGVQDYIHTRLTGVYKLGDYPARIIEMQLKDFMKTDPAASQVYSRALEASRAGNTPLLRKIEGDLSRHAEKAIRQYLGDWQKATNQRVNRQSAPAPVGQKPKVVPLYSAPPTAPVANGRDSEFGSVSDAFGDLYKQMSPYVNQ